MLQKHYFIIYLFMPRGATKNQRRKTKRLESLYSGAAKSLVHLNPD